MARGGSAQQVRRLHYVPTLSPAHAKPCPLGFLTPLRQRYPDALHTQRDFMQILNAQHAHTVLLVKENQPTLYTDLVTYFGDPAARYTQAETWDRHRGHMEVRRIKVSPEMTAYLSASWPHVAQVAELTRIVTYKGQTRHEVVYLITSLSPAQADPLRLLALVRGHWSIENSLHYVRDVTFGEDHSRVRTGNAPQVMAALRNVTITLIHRAGFTQIAATRRHFAFHPRQALALVL